MQSGAQKEGNQNNRQKTFFKAFVKILSKSKMMVIH